MGLWLDKYLWGYWWVRSKSCFYLQQDSLGQGCLCWNTIIVASELVHCDCFIGVAFGSQAQAVEPAAHMAVKRQGAPQGMVGLF